MIDALELICSVTTTTISWERKVDADDTKEKTMYIMIKAVRFLSNYSYKYTLCILVF